MENLELDSSNNTNTNNEMNDIEMNDVVDNENELATLVCDVSTAVIAIESKSVKYKTMLLNGVTITESKITSDNIDNLDKFLEAEKNTNINDSWSNLDKTVKIKKLIIYAESYKESNELSDAEHGALVKCLKDAIDHKKIQRVKDVVYDKTTGLIKSIPALNFNKSTNHFTLKNMEKRVSTLKSLPQKKTSTRGTAKLN